MGLPIQVLMRLVPLMLVVLVTARQVVAAEPAGGSVANGQSAASAGSQVPAVAAPAVADTIAQRAKACTVCHGQQGRASTAGFFPRIAGKPAGYLYNQVVNFREGRRSNEAMAYLLEHLSDAYLQEIADYFGGLELPYAPPQSFAAAPAELERGRVLVADGDAGQKIPGCVSCHGPAMTGVLPAIPGLLGLPRDYLLAQFGAWRTGQRRAAAPDCMAQIAARLSAADISAVATWLAAQAVPADAKPVATLPHELPLGCGSAGRQ